MAGLKMFEIPALPMAFPDMRQRLGVRQPSAAFGRFLWCGALPVAPLPPKKRQRTVALQNAGEIHKSCEEIPVTNSNSRKTIP